MVVKNLPLVGIAAILFSGAAIWKMNPVERRVVEIKEIKKVEKVERIVIPKPVNVKYEPLKDPKQACTNAPVEIVSMDVSAAQGKDENYNYTWFTVRPVGDIYTVACNKGGSYDKWKVGDIVVLNGEPTG